jgi:hypothetical protein
LVEIARNYKPIAAELKSAKWARILRNKISFHYDQEHALLALQRLDDDHPLRFIAGRIKGLTLFEFAEEIVHRPIFEDAGSGDIGHGMDVVDKFLVNLISSITTFHAQTTVSIFKVHKMVSERIQSEVRESYCADPDDIHVPISISSGYIESGKGKKVGNRT